MSKTPIFHRTYIAGPIRGLSESEAKRRFADAADLLRGKGHDPLNPFDVHPPQEAKFHERTSPEFSDLCVRADLIEVLKHCDQIMLLPGWKDSIGARIEAAVAKTLGFKFFDGDGTPIPTPASVPITSGYYD